VVRLAPNIILSLRTGVFEIRAACPEGFEIYKNTEVVAHNVGNGYAIGMQLTIDGESVKLAQTTMKPGVASVQEGKAFQMSYEDADGKKHSTLIKVKRVRVPSPKGEMAALVHWEVE
jgi:hypothetical protein